MSKSSHMKESLKQRNEAKEKLLTIARGLFKSEKKLNHYSTRCGTLPVLHLLID